jgi:hypothetical protein
MTKLIVAFRNLVRAPKINRGIYNKFNSADIITAIKVADWNSLCCKHGWRKDNKKVTGRQTRMEEERKT